MKMAEKNIFAFCIFRKHMIVDTKALWIDEKLLKVAKALYDGNTVSVITREGKVKDSKYS